MMGQFDSHIFYRSIKESRPAERDFLSPAALGRPCRSNDPHIRRSWEGVSVFDTYGAARANAEKWNWKPGRYVAELLIPRDLSIIYDGPHNRGHWDLHAVAAFDLLRCVTRVFDAQSTRTIPAPR